MGFDVLGKRSREREGKKKREREKKKISFKLKSKEEGKKEGRGKKGGKIEEEKEQRAGRAVSLWLQKETLCYPFARFTCRQ